jgi:hypothetical protein
MPPWGALVLRPGARGVKSSRETPLTDRHQNSLKNRAKRRFVNRIHFGMTPARAECSVRMSRYSAFAVWLAFVVFVVATAQTMSNFARAYLVGPTYTMGASQGDGRTSVHIAGMHVNRVCASGRCELFVRAEGESGHRIFASHPASDRVCIADGRIEVRRDGTCRGGDERRRDPWLAIAAFGIVIALVQLRGWRLSVERARIDHARPAVQENDALVFVDGLLPARGVSTVPLPPGPVTALHRVEDRHTLGDGPFRQLDATHYFCVSGARGDHLLEIERARGWNRAFGWMTAAVAAGAFAFAMWA